MSQKPPTPMTQMHDFIIDTQLALFQENKSPDILKAILLLNELSKVTQELLAYEIKYLDVVKKEGIEEGIDTAKKILDNELNNLGNGNFFNSCIN